jgi:hypothetical protein
VVEDWAARMWKDGGVRMGRSELCLAAAAPDPPIELTDIETDSPKDTSSGRK